MIKFIIKETIEWEGYGRWTVFALSKENAFTMIKANRKYNGNELTIISQRSIKGTKEEKIHKIHESFNQ